MNTEENLRHVLIVTDVVRSPFRSDVQEMFTTVRSGVVVALDEESPQSLDSRKTHNRPETAVSRRNWQP